MYLGRNPSTGRMMQDRPRSVAFAVYLLLDHITELCFPKLRRLSVEEPETDNDDNWTPQHSRPGNRELKGGRGRKKAERAGLVFYARATEGELT